LKRGRNVLETGLRRIEVVKHQKKSEG